MRRIGKATTTLGKRKLNQFYKVRTGKQLVLKLLQEGEVLLTDRQENIKSEKIRNAKMVENAYNLIGRRYNTEVDRINGKITKLKRQLRTGKKVSYKWDTQEELIEVLNHSKKFPIVSYIGNQITTLSTNNIMRITNLLKSGNLFGDEEDAKNSDEKYAFNIVSNPDAPIIFQRLQIEDRQKKTRKGQFFKYTHNLDYDFSSLQIYNKVDVKENNYDGCFIYSLEQSGVLNEVKLNSVKCNLKSNDISFKTIENIAMKHSIKFMIREPDEKTPSKVRVINKDGVNEVKLGRIDEHYFIIKDMEITSYAIKNYEDVKGLKEWWKIYKMKNGKYERSNTRFIDSFNVVKTLMSTEGALTKITKSDEVFKTIYHTKVEGFGNLNYDEEVNTKVNEYKDKYEMRTGNRYFHGKERRVFTFDFETTTEGERHIPYMCCLYNDDVNECFYGETCGFDMLIFLGENYEEYEIYLIAHNAGYDLRFLYDYFNQGSLNVIQRGKSLLQAKGNFSYNGSKMPIIIQDSYAFIATRLSSFGKMFGLEQQKEIIPYGLYNKENVKKQFISKTDIIKYLKHQFKTQNIGVKKDDDYNNKCNEYVKQFYDNCSKWDCVRANAPKTLCDALESVEETIDIIKYSKKYCEMDCIVLWEGYKKFKGWINDVCELDIGEYISLPSLANDYMLKEGVYDNVYMLSGVPREYIQKSMVGGRTMTARNKKWRTKNEIADYDGVSLYPSSMDRLGDIGGYIQGRPKVLENLTYDYLRQQDAYFIKIRITEVGKKYDFPLMSKVTKEGIRDFNNDMIGEEIYVDKISLEDLIEFHKIKFDVIDGYYYNEGRNNTIKSVINHLFNTRLEMKKQKNQIQEVYKLLMNSAYGKTLLKPFDTEDKYINGKFLNNHLVKNYDKVKEIIELYGTQHTKTYKVIHDKEINNHFNNAHIGVEVLSMSKRIMNEVMTTGEDVGCKMYYQDTDSIHIELKDVEKLEQAYESKYGKVLNGKQLGQFHIDFSSDVCKGELKAVESIFLGKKCYIDKLEGDKKGVYDYHIRMKGVSDASIRHFKEKNNTDYMSIYDDLYKGNSLQFDLACDGLKCCFEYNKDFTIESKSSFIRNIKF